MRTLLVILVALLGVALVRECLSADGPLYYAQIYARIWVPQRLVDATVKALVLEDGVVEGVHLSSAITYRHTDAKTKLVCIPVGGTTEEACTLDKLYAAYRALLRRVSEVPGGENPSALLNVSVAPLRR